ncbi:MAG: hypothetical protein ABIT01_13130 [Thermoanaerobaculia bacterium]
MRDLRIFATKLAYERHVFTELVSDPLIAEHPFYRRLIQFVLDGKAPLFYLQSDPTEFRNFSAYYHFILDRETYTNETLRSMYFLHDFTHMLFYYPHDVSSVTQEEFEEAVISSEYAASNETEVLVHYRVPGLRERVFQDRRIFFDLLRERGVAQPPVHSLLHLRKTLVERDVLDPYFFQDARDAPVRETLKSYAGNGAWCKHRMREIRRLKDPTEYFYRFLTPTNYERVLASYESTATQESYERVTLRNLRLAYELLGLANPPMTFAEGLARANELEGRVLVTTITPPEDR